MISSKAAKRYATALLGFAEEKGNTEGILKDINMIQKTLEGSRELVVFLKSPIIKPEQKINALEAVFKSKISGETWSFLELLGEKSRLDLLNGVTHAFIDAYNKNAGIIEAEIIYFDDPESGQLDSIKSILEKQTGKTVQLIKTHNPEIIGGVMVRLGDTVIDGSVRNKLQQLEQQFSTAAI